MKNLTLAAILAAGCASTEEYKLPKATGPLFTDSGELMEQAPPSEAVAATPAQPVETAPEPAQENPFAKLVDPRAILRGEKPADTIPQPKPRPRAPETAPSAPEKVEYVTVTVAGAYKFSTPSSYGAFLGTFPEGKLSMEAALRAAEITSEDTFADDSELGAYLTGKTVKIVHTDKLGFEFGGTYRVPKNLAARFTNLQEKSSPGRLLYYLEKFGKKELDSETITGLERLNFIVKLD